MIKFNSLLFRCFVCAVGLLFLWVLIERRVEEARLSAWAECRQQEAEQARKLAENKNKRITKNVQQKLEILSSNDVGFDALLELMRLGQL